MVRLTAATVLAMIATDGEAGALRCSFTEPFFTITWDSQTGQAIELSADVTDPDTGKPVPRTLSENARLRVPDPTGDPFRLVLEDDKETILELKLTGTGSDGMSDSLFPFEARRGRLDGGCETAKYPAFDTYDLLQDLGVNP
jgi:hypothetical protein